MTKIDHCSATEPWLVAGDMKMQGPEIAIGALLLVGSSGRLPGVRPLGMQIRTQFSTQST